MGLDSDELSPDPTNPEQVKDVPAPGRRRKGLTKQISPEKSKRAKIDAEHGEKGNPEPCLDQVLRDEIDIVEDLSISSPIKKSVRIKKPSPKKAETMELEETVKSKRSVEDNITIKKKKSVEMQPVMPVEDNKTTSSEPLINRKLKKKVSKPCSPNQKPPAKTGMLRKKKGNLKPEVTTEDPSPKSKAVSKEVLIPESDRSPFKKPLLSGAAVERRESSESRISVDTLKISGRPRKRRDSNSSSVSNSSDTSTRSVRSRHGSSSSNTSDTSKKEKSKLTKMPDNLPVVPLLSRRKGRKAKRLAAADGSGPVKILKKKVLKKTLNFPTSEKPEEKESFKTSVVAKKKKTVTAKDDCKGNEATSSASKPSQAQSIKSDSSPTKEQSKPVKVKSKNSAGQEKPENPKAKNSVVKSPIKGFKANKEGPSMEIKKKKKVVKKAAPVKPVPEDDDDTDVEDGMTLVHVDDEITLNISDESLIQLEKMKSSSNPKSSQTNEESGSSKSFEIKKIVGRKKKLAKTETVTEKESAQAETKNKNKADGSSKPAAKADIKATDGVLKKKNLDTSEGVNSKKKKMEDGGVKKAATVNEAGEIKKKKKKRILEEDGVLKKKMVGGVVKKKTGIAGGKRKGRSGANTRSVNLHL